MDYLKEQTIEEPNLPEEVPVKIEVPQVDEIDLTERANRPGTVTERSKLSLLEDPFMKQQ